MKKSLAIFSLCVASTVAAPSVAVANDDVPIVEALTKVAGEVCKVKGKLMMEERQKGRSIKQAKKNVNKKFNPILKSINSNPNFKEGGMAEFANLISQAADADGYLYQGAWKVKVKKSNKAKKKAINEFSMLAKQSCMEIAYEFVQEKIQ